MRTFYVTNINDSFVEFNEICVVELIDSRGASIGPNFFANVTILYEEQPPGRVGSRVESDNVTYSPETPFNLTPGANNKVYAVGPFQPEPEDHPRRRIHDLQHQAAPIISRVSFRTVSLMRRSKWVREQTPSSRRLPLPDQCTNTIIANRDKVGHRRRIHLLQRNHPLRHRPAK